MSEVDNPPIETSGVEGQNLAPTALDDKSDFTPPVDGSKKFEANTPVDENIDAEFVRQFGDGHVAGGDKVWKEAQEGSPTERKGDELQMAVANDLGPDEIAAMEQDFYPPESKNSPVDLVTNDQPPIAIECKNYKHISPSDLEDFVDQAQTRVQPNQSGETEYQNAIIVVPDGKMTEKDILYANDQSQHPGVYICEQSQLQSVLAQIRSVK